MCSRAHPQSEETKQKISIALKGHPVSAETRRKIGLGHKGKPKQKLRGHPFWGPRHFSEETKKKIREHLMGHSTSEETRQKIALALKGKSLSEERKKKISIALTGHPLSEERREKFKRPTFFERKIINLIDLHSLPFKYVGDGRIKIARKNPDFIERNGEPLLIEVSVRYVPPSEEQQRIESFATHGFKTLFLHEDDLCRDDWAEHCLQKINNFIQSNTARSDTINA